MTALPRQVIAAAILLVLAAPASRPLRAADGRNLVRNGDFEQAGADATAAGFALSGDAARVYVGTAHEIASTGIALDSGRDLDGDGRHEGSVAQDVPVGKGPLGRWFRFTIRGLPEDGFAVDADHLLMKADFYGDDGGRPLDGVTRKLYPLVEQERRDLTANGVRHKGGAETWRTYAFEFRLPFPDVDMVRLSVGFRDGKGKENNARFLVDEMTLVAIPTPADAPTSPAIRPARPASVDPATLVSIGGRWLYRPAAGEAVATGGKGLVVDDKNADRLFYREGAGRYLNPFAENMSAMLKKGYLDVSGELVEEDQVRPDNVTITFDANRMIVHARNLPNHPTAKFPGVTSGGDRNPNYIQEQDATYTIPLVPSHDPDAQAMADDRNSNRALPMGPIGFAVNGVVFFNPFDANVTDATDLMDRCCGHPDPRNQYHYHKYPVCVKSPFADEGQEHSPPIGWAFDGYAIHGPYEGDGVMAKDSAGNPLNAFNGHEDPDRGFHYHVTPGKFPYILGGYWGKVERRGRGGPGMAGGPPPGGPPPIMGALDADHNRAISAKEIASAPTALKGLDRNRDGKLTRDELLPRGGPGGGPPGLGGSAMPPVLRVIDTDGDGAISAKEIGAASAALKTLDRDGDGALSVDEFRPPPFGRGPRR